MMRTILLIILFSFLAHANFNDPLIDAADTGNLHAIKVLLNKDATIVNTHGFASCTALMRASYKGHIEIIKLLLEKGAQLNLQDEGGATALHYAVRAKNNEAIKLLIDRGADPNIKDYIGFTVTERAKLENVKLPLLEKKTIIKQTPLLIKPVINDSVTVEISSPTPPQEETLVVGKAMVIQEEDYNKSFSMFEVEIYGFEKDNVYFMEFIKILKQIYVMYKMQPDIKKYTIMLGDFKELSQAHSVCTKVKEINKNLICSVLIK